ncbi:MAG: hypothetical protein R3A52_08690 [Polyangiales bacterium]
MSPTDAMTSADVPSTSGAPGFTAVGAARTLPNEIVDGSDRTTVAVTDPDACLRSYTHHHRGPARRAALEPRAVTERTDWPTLARATRSSTRSRSPSKRCGRTP